VLSLIANWSLHGAIYSVVAPVRWFGIDMPARFSDFGANLLDGLVNGIRSRLANVRAAITSIGDSVANWFKDKLGIRSPSRVFAALAASPCRAGARAGGQPARRSTSCRRSPESWASALALPSARTRPRQACASTVARPSPLPARSAPAATPAASTPVVIHIHPPTGTNEQAIARMVATEIQRLDAQKARACVPA
jgi:hypothetical protein